MVEAQERQPSDPSKILIVTGGSRGIGAATSLVAAQRGYAVCVNISKEAAKPKASCGRLRVLADAPSQCKPMSARSRMLCVCLERWTCN